MKYLFRVLLGLACTAAILFVMLHAISWQDVKNSVLVLKWWSIVLIISTILVISLVKALRFFFILRFGNVSASLPNTIRIFIASQAFTPLPAGEVGRAMLFKNELGVHLNEVAGPVFLQALLELWTATLSVVVAAFFAGGMMGLWIIGLVGLLAILTVPLLCSKYFPRFFAMLKARGMTYAWIDKMRLTLHHFEQLVSLQGKKKAWRFWIVVTALGLLAHMIGGGLLWYIAQIEGVHITIAQCIFAAGMAVLISGILGIIPGGLGVTEGGLVGILSRFAIPWQKTIIITLLYRVATLPLLIVIALVFLIFMYGKNIVRFISLKST